MTLLTENGMAKMRSVMREILDHGASYHDAVRQSEYREKLATSLSKGIQLYRATQKRLKGKA